MEPLRQPPKWKIALLAWGAAFPMIYGLSIFFNTYFPELNSLIRQAISSMLLIGLLTFIIMPFLSKLFSTWLTK